MAIANAKHLLFVREANIGRLEIQAERNWLNGEPSIRFIILERDLSTNYAEVFNVIECHEGNAMWVCEDRAQELMPRLLYVLDSSTGEYSHPDEITVWEALNATLLKDIATE